MNRIFSASFLLLSVVGIVSSRVVNSPGGPDESRNGLERGPAQHDVEVEAEMKNATVACEGDGYYLPSNCSSTYFMCMNNTGMMYTCEPGLYYDIETKECMRKSDVPACKGQVDSSFVICLHPFGMPECINFAPGRYMSDFCLGAPDGLYSEYRCTDTYVNCTGGVTHMVKCPNNMLFDIVHGSCVSLDKVPECRVVDVVINVCYHETCVIPAFNSTAVCLNKKPGFYAHDTCSSYFYSCHPDHSDVLRCNPNLVFDSETKSCKPISEMTDCKGNLTYYVRTYRGQNPDKCEQEGFYAESETACSSVYYGCATGTFPVEYECPGDLKFDPKYKLCESESKIDACKKE